MRKLLIPFLCLMLSFMTLFLSLGYAALTDVMDITGVAEYKEPEAIYITDIQIDDGYDSNKITGTPSATKIGFLFLQFGDFTLRKQDGWNTGGSITVTITLRNNSGVDQFLSGHNVNSTRLSTKIDSSTPLGTLIPKNTSGIIKIIIQNTNKYSDISANEFQVSLLFDPKFDASHTETVTKGVAEHFANLLNNPSFTYNGQTIDSTQELLTAMRGVWNSVDTGGYFGNVGNADQNQKELINAMFGENITITIGNHIYSVSVLVKNQKIGNDNENDMVLYITADQLDVGGGRWDSNAAETKYGRWQDLNIVPVYALIYIKEGDKYNYCDHMFAGTAPVCNFKGAFGNGNVGNFNTNLWISTDYELSDNSNGYIDRNNVTKDGELDEAYEEYLKTLPKN